MSYDPNMNEQTELPGEMYDEIVEILYEDFGRLPPRRR